MEIYIAVLGSLFNLFILVAVLIWAIRWERRHLKQASMGPAQPRATFSLKAMQSLLEKSRRRRLEWRH